MKIFEREKMLHDDGKAEGEARLVGIIRRKLAKNMSVSDISELLEIEEAYVNQIARLIAKYPDYSDFDIADM